MLAKKRLKRSQNNWNLILGVTPAQMEGQLATEDMRSQEVPYEILSVNCVVEILDKVFKLAYIYRISSKSFRSVILASLE